jgi:maltooligosyltrehalose trehalohydrolase
MGEEWFETNPFLFFIDHTDAELAAMVNKGRKEEFAYFNWQAEPPDPRLEETFNRSLLQWDLLKKEPHNAMFKFYKTLIRLRKSHPVLQNPDRNKLKADADEINKTIVLNRWNDNHWLMCTMNFSNNVHEIKTGDQYGWSKMLDSADPAWNGPKAAPDKILKGEKIIIQPESILIYERN